MAALSTLAAVGAGLATSYLLKPKAPKQALTPPPVAPPPDPSIALLAAARAAQQTALLNKRRNQSTAGGAGVNPSTLLTGPSGLTTPPPVQRKTLLGY
jgi:hypothetical protein